MSFPTPFALQPGSGTLIAANATPSSVNATLAAAGSATKLRIFNAGTVMVFVRPCYTTSSPPAATAADMPVAPNSAIIIDGNNVLGVSALSSTTTAANVYAQWGEGGA